ncbi:Gfo/Idh/MocA family protein [Coraliomargarita akajimensis]|uniref:Oxidoreductase domain protein n=1 Tax=Coraliomargarita akajimensis (strain DSM 45221 / IAM 15411 / JCM 23193 / KCTC 12865 / 04OKA010-24) TaxID=583355 RepID=D5ENR7_CORAD|nr:Gfo/Idh/MocA family oxidoreductase [Coraliomargarita akajimensis]ADE53576.1 oxidoreductase domain protein [Coraliomargarita akajimensis DSM 45221]
MNQTPNTLTRRQALAKFAIAGAGIAILPSSLRGAGAPSNRLNIAMIGTGRQGINANMKTFLGMKDVRVVAVCDVDRKRVNYAKAVVDAKYGDSDCQVFGDFREAMEVPGLDAVMISTTDHWHAIMALHAMKKGLHVCCEKALTRYFDESQAMVAAAKKTGLVFRTDTECRSNAYMIKTANLVKNGYIGNIQRIEVGVPREFSQGIGDPTVLPVPEYLDYEMWQGPARRHPYSIDRVHKTNTETGQPVGRPGWLRLEDYCAGMICNWGAHLMDVANLCNGTSDTGPISCEGTGEFPTDPAGMWDTIESMDLHYKYANGVSLDYKIAHAYVRIEGDEGWIQSNWFGKSGLQAHDRNIFRTKFRESDQLVSTKSDKRDFVDAVLKGAPVMIDAEAGHRVHSQCMLGLAAIKSGDKLTWDPVAEKITNSAKAQAILDESYYDPKWDLKQFII